MKTVNMHEAKTHLSKLVEQAVDGEPFVIARSGKPLVKVVKLEPSVSTRTGFLKGLIDIPEDFDTMCDAEIEAMFSGKSDSVDPT